VFRAIAFEQPASVLFWRLRQCLHWLGQNLWVRILFSKFRGGYCTSRDRFGGSNAQSPAEPSRLPNYASSPACASLLPRGFEHVRSNSRLLELGRRPCQKSKIACWAAALCADVSSRMIRLSAARHGWANSAPRPHRDGRTAYTQCHRLVS
jgi:hypothetical protein